MEYNNERYDSYGRAYDEMSAEAYNLVIGGMLLYGFLVNCLMIKFCFDSVADLIMNNPMMYYLSYFAMIFAGWFMIKKSSSTVMSFIGYNLIVVPLGMVISFVVNVYVMAGYSDIIATAFGITAVVTLLVMFVSSIYPDFFLSMGHTLGITLLITIVVEAVMYFGFHMDLGIIDYIVVLLFCGYIGYDWARANSLPKTVYNAVDSAAELYVDIVNLFIRLMRILARSQKR